MIARAYEMGDGSLFVPVCPICGNKHWHGQGEGWRWSHCLRGSDAYYLKLAGSVLDLDPRQRIAP